MSKEIETTILNVLKEVMENDNISINDDFYELGGDSKKAMLLLSKLKQNNINISLSDFFSCRNVSELALKNQKNGVDYKEIVDRMIASIDLKETKNYDEYENYQIDEIEYQTYDNILLTGGTGFLGSHLADKILHNTQSNLYFLIRGKNIEDCRERITNIWQKYKLDDNLKKYADRIFIVTGDVSQNKLGMNPIEYNKLAQCIDVILHSAAVVSHIETWEKYQRINIDGTKNLLKFSTYLKKKDFNFISTIATEITQDRLVSMDIFKEKSLVNAKSDVLYVQSKIECERMVEEHRKKGFNVKIFRMGFLVENYSNGLFQLNANENGFFNIMSLLCEMKAFPLVKNNIIDLTFVDDAADAVIKLMHIKDNGYIYHIINDKISLADLALKFKEHDPDINIYDIDRYKEFLYNNLSKYEKYIEKMALILMIDTDVNLNIFSVSSNERTKAVLEKLGFKWHDLDDKRASDIYRIICKIQSEESRNGEKTNH